MDGGRVMSGLSLSCAKAPMIAYGRFARKKLLNQNFTTGWQRP
jgi:hypothetical protein